MVLDHLKKEGIIPYPPTKISDEVKLKQIEMEAKALANKETLAKQEHQVKMLELKKLVEQEKREFQAQAQAKALEAQALADELKREFEAKHLAQTSNT